MGLSLYHKTFKKEILILTGTGGTSSSNSAEKVASHLTQISRVPGIPFSARIEQTNGLADIESRVGADAKGQVIGYYINCKKRVDHMKTLLPLDHEYLYILARVAFLDAATIPTRTTGGGEHYEFGDIIRHLKNSPLHSNIYAGPDGSTTRYVAERIFELADIEQSRFEQYLNPAIDDWNEAKAALRNGTIDIMFFMGPSETDTIRDIVEHELSAVMVGISEYQEGLKENEDYSLLYAHFLPNAYTAPPILVPHSTGTDEVPALYNFCPTTIQTIATRRVMACSSSMDPRDAYEIAVAVKEALQSGPFIGNWDTRKVPDSIRATEAEHDLGLNPHPGAEWLEKGPPPQLIDLATWSPVWTSAFSSALLFALTLCVQSLKGRAARKRGAQPAGGPSSNHRPETYGYLVERFGKELRALERRTEPFERDEWDQEWEKTRYAHREICDLVNASQIAERDAEVLFAALRNIRDELDFVEPPDRVASGRATTTTKKARG
jgi:hypothetical protein